jgi:hypothetical protein
MARKGAIDDAVFAPGSPEVEIARKDGTPVALQGERGKMAEIMLTNDRILLTHESFGPSGSIIGGLAEMAAEGVANRKADGPREIVRLSDLRAGTMQHRKLIPDLYMLTLADGRTCRLHRALRKKWDPMIRRLLAERHGLTVTDDDEDDDGWRAAVA